MHNTQLLTIYNALAAIAANVALPFDVSYAVARNLKAMKNWHTGFMDAREAAVKAAGGTCAGENLMLDTDYKKLSPELKEQYTRTILAIGNEEPLKLPDFYTIKLSALLNRADGRVIELPAAAVEPLLDIIILTD